MKFPAVTLAVNAFLLYSSMVNADNIDSPSLTASDNFVKLSFQKKYGDSFEDASSDRKAEARLVKRGDDYELVEVTNQSSFYSVDLDIGTPSQKVTVLVDTGSSDLWVTGSNNPYCSTEKDSTSGSSFKKVLKYDLATVVDSVVTEISYDTTISVSEATATVADTSSASDKIDCSTYGTFDSSKSSTFESNKTDFSITYGDQSFASGTWGHDQLNLNDLNVTGLSFAVANETNSTVGVLGIGLPGLESTYSGVSLSSAQVSYTYNNFPMVLKNSGAIKSTAYSLYLNESDAEHGTILFGAVDHAKYSGGLYTIPIINTLQRQGYKNPIQFQVTLQGLGLTDSLNESNHTTLTTTKIPALLDSGSTISYMPTELVEMLAENVGASYSSKIGFYTMDCISSTDTDIEISFDFGGFFINGWLSTYQISTDSASKVCILGFAPQSDSTIILGDNFLAHAYVVYDLENMEISMAQADYDNKEEDVDTIEDSIPSAVKAPSYSSTWSTIESITSGGDIFTISSSSSTQSSGSASPSATGSSSSNSQKNDTTASLSNSKSRSTVLSTSVPSTSRSTGSSTATSSSTSSASGKKENSAHNLKFPFFAKLLTKILCYIS